jgi:hypothetical protein
MTTKFGSRAQVGWGFWLQWVVANTVGIGLAVKGIDGVARPTVDASVSNPALRRVLMVFSIAVIAVVLGGVQWLVLRRRIGQSAWWGIATAITFWVGASVVEVAYFAGVSLTAGFVVDFLLSGPVCGILQWQILKRQVTQAGWWALTLPLSWVVGFAVYAAVGFAVNLTVASPAFGATFGATTGAALVWLLRRPAPAPARVMLAAG